VPPRYRNLLVAFDGSPASELALGHAVMIAQACRAKLALVAVVAPPPLISWQAPGGMRGVYETEQTELEQRLREAADQVPDDLPVTTRLVDGDPARELVRAARDGEHDLIVMGSRGRGRVSTAVLGSVSNHVMREAGVPVIVIHPPDGGPGLAA
jgi:nucleotide-binding universal stress UspA family protein